MLYRASVGHGRGPARSASSSRRTWRCRALQLLSLIALLATAGLAAEISVFGPQTYNRGTGKPVAVRKTFRIKSPSGKYTLRVVNHGVTSGVISLNGKTILEPKDFTFKRGRPWRDDEWERHTGGRDDDQHGGGSSEGRDRDARNRDGRLTATSASRRVIAALRRLT